MLQHCALSECTNLNGRGTMKKRLVLIVCALSLLTIGCGPLEDLSPSDINTSSCTEQYSKTEDNICTPCPKGENCYENETILQNFISDVGIPQAYAARLPEISQPLWYLIKEGQDVNTPCYGDGKKSVADSESFFYCPPDSSIYVGEKQLQSFYDRGDNGMTAKLGLKHEWGHHWLSQQLAVTTLSGRNYELAADCVMGAIFKEVGYSPENIRYAYDTLMAISTDDPSDIHGNADQRMVSLIAGEKDPTLESCKQIATGEK